MQVYSDRFETVLPKGARFFTPPTKQKPPTKEVAHHWIGYLMLASFLFSLGWLIPRPQAPAPTLVATKTVVAPTSPPLPEVRRAMPIPVQTSGTAPRAQLLHVRPIGTVENDQMPDGRVLSTRYMGELSGAGSLPTRGANLGDMWYTQNDGHCWVLAPLPGSSTVGWIDP